MPRFGEARGELWKIFAKFTEWLENEQPPWDTYHELMDDRLFNLDNHPGVRPVGLRDTWWRMKVNYILKVDGKESNEDCGTD